MLNNPTRSKEEELHKASSIVTDIAYIDSCNLTIRYKIRGLKCRDDYYYFCFIIEY